MEIDYFREFAILTETSNFMEAADKLFLSQSALSRHIKSMEADLGVQLFNRTTRRVTLTNFGRILLPYAKEISRIQYEYTTGIYNELNIEHGSIRIGSIPVMAQYNITDVLARFQRENVNFCLDVIEADSTQLIKMLRSNQCDFAFLRELGPTASGEFNELVFTTDHLSAVVPLSSPLARESYICLEQLIQEPLLLLSKSSFMYSMCVQVCREAGFEPRVVYTGNRAENIVDLVSKDMGIGLLTKKPVLYLKPQGVAIIDIQPSITTRICLAYPKEKELSPAASHFLNLVKSI